MDSSLQKLVGIIVAPVAIFGVVMLVYAIAYLVDRIQYDTSEALTMDEFTQRLMTTGIIREAGLAGLLAPERIRVYRHFFEHKAFAYEKPVEIPDQEEATKVEAKHAVDVPSPEVGEKEVQMDAEEVEVSKNDETSETTETVNADAAEETEQDADFKSGKDTEDAKQESKEGAAGGAPSCSICLIDYENGDKVMVGTRCEHMFHFDCCMQWIEKGNEICPYCRETMITAQDFLQSARELLGDDRIAKLHRINQTAARRLADLSAQNNATSPGEANSDVEIEMAAPSSTTVPVSTSV
eukprot:Nitzschia sp. Nitz4//scaffold25_size161228//60904//61856//NITZ4_002425-RA/size161228-augustus-gene-0.127-mRNA-1//-1//CDS//3329544571//7931//frame0